MDFSCCVVPRFVGQSRAKRLRLAGEHGDPVRGGIDRRRGSGPGGARSACRMAPRSSSTCCSAMSAARAPSRSPCGPGWRGFGDRGLCPCCPVAVHRRLHLVLERHQLVRVDQRRTQIDADVIILHHSPFWPCGSVCGGAELDADDALPVQDRQVTLHRARVAADRSGDRGVGHPQHRSPMREQNPGRSFSRAVKVMYMDGRGRSGVAVARSKVRARSIVGMIRGEAAVGGGAFLRARLTLGSVRPARTLRRQVPLLPGDLSPSFFGAHLHRPRLAARSLTQSSSHARSLYDCGIYNKIYISECV